MDRKQITKIRKAVAKAKSESGLGRVRYPEFIKQVASDWFDSGGTPTEFARLTGVGSATAFKWTQKTKSFRSVKVAVSERADYESEGFRVILPSGLRIEGVSVQLLKQILEWGK